MQTSLIEINQQFLRTRAIEIFMHISYLVMVIENIVMNRIEIDVYNIVNKFQLIEKIITNNIHSNSLYTQITIDSP